MSLEFFGSPQISEATSWLPGYATIIAGVAAVAFVGVAYVAKNQLDQKAEGSADAEISAVAADNTSEGLGRYTTESGARRSRRLAR